MTSVYLTIDTEYSAALPHRPCRMDRAENFARSIACLTPDGPVGIPYQLEVLERTGQRATFFVDPMPALVWGVGAVADVVEPILKAGQDVQLHCHAEWLELAPDGGPLEGLKGRNIKDFTLDHQVEILGWARETLMAAGGPEPVAFRAGNYGANDDTLRALAKLGLRYDSSHTPGLPHGESAINLPQTITQPVLYEGIVEVPTGVVSNWQGGLRHAQITAISTAEALAGIAHARDHQLPAFTIVSHSFELVNRRTLRANKVVAHRFSKLCESLASMPGVSSGDFATNPPLRLAVNRETPRPPRPPALQIGQRYAEQALSNLLYGAL